MENQATSTMKLTSRYIVPFTYDKSVLCFHNLSLNNENWELESQSKQEQDVYDYIKNSFLTKETLTSDNISPAIACMYRYKKLPQNFKLLYKSATCEYYILIRDMHLVLFQNGIGFLWYTPAFASNSLPIEDAIDFTYYFKELARNEFANRIFIESVHDYNESLDIPEEAILPGRKKYKKTVLFSMGVWLADILATLNCPITFYPFRTSSKSDLAVPDKALLFHHGVFETSTMPIKSAYYLTRGYKSSYKISDEVKQEMLHPFDNLYCFATSEGCGYYAYADTSNSAFFHDPTKVMTDYFLLYLLSLYQSYSLLMFSEKIAHELSANASEYAKPSAKISASLDDITTELNVFLAKSVYSSVSYVQHQNDFFEYVSKKLRIHENIASVSAGIDALRNLEMHLEAEEVAKKNASLETGITLISLLAIFSAFVDANEFVRNYLWDMFNPTQPIEVLIINGIVLGITFAVIFCCLRFIKMHIQLWQKNRKHRK